MIEARYERLFTIQPRSVFPRMRNPSENSQSEYVKKIFVFEQRLFGIKNATFTKPERFGFQHKDLVFGNAILDGTALARQEFTGDLPCIVTLKTY